MSDQITDTLLMVRPVAFHRNEQTATNNYYQKTLEGLTAEQIQECALEEFDTFVEKLRAVGVRVVVFEDTAEPEKPDSIFPNNWVSFHESGEVILYPMYASNRRLERRNDLLEALRGQFRTAKVTSMAHWEDQGRFLEGTGSLVLDRRHGVAYAALSERTHPEVLQAWQAHTGYEVVTFRALQTVAGRRLPIYHTNVMMCVGEQFAVVCTDSIDHEPERKSVLSTLERTGHEVLLISEVQKERFAGNMLQVRNPAGQRYVLMSAAAFGALSADQKDRLAAHGTLLYSSLDTIEALGGGSARCMMAEVFLEN